MWIGEKMVQRIGLEKIMNNVGHLRCIWITCLIGSVVLLSRGIGFADLVQDAIKEGSLVFYSTMTPDHQDIIVKSFNRKYPAIKVDSFRGNNSTINNRFLTEARTGSNFADVIGIDGLNGWVFKEKGLLQSYNSKEAAAFPPAFQDPEGVLLCCSYVSTVAIAYNPRLVAKADVPKTYEDLLLPKWKGKLGMNSDMPESFAARVKAWGKDKTVNYFTGLMKQDASIRRGRTLLLQLLGAGEFNPVVEVFAYRVLELQDQKVPVEIVQAEPNLAWPMRLVLAKRASHPNAGKLFIDYILSSEGQSLIGSLGRAVVRPGVKLKYPRLVEGVKLFPVPPDIAKDFEESSRLFRSIVN
jgi:iron(III) transport system substrate-binding protein